MKPLPLTFRKNGWNYRQIKREGRIALYSQGGGVAYEVFRVLRNNTRTIGGRVVEAHEAVPADSLWGRQGWTCHTLERAEELMATLVLKEKQNSEKGVGLTCSEAA